MEAARAGERASNCLNGAAAIRLGGLLLQARFGGNYPSATQNNPRLCALRTRNEQKDRTFILSCA
jgi:hypothetical protein